MRQYLKMVKTRQDRTSIERLMVRQAIGDGSLRGDGATEAKQILKSGPRRCVLRIVVVVQSTEFN